MIACATSSRRAVQMKTIAILALFFLAPVAIRTISAQSIPYQRPVDTAPQEHSIGGGYKTPAVQKPLPRNSWLQVLDVVVLAAALAISSWLVLKRRSRKALVAAGHWFGGLFRLLPRGLGLPDRVDPERRGGVDGSAILDPHGGDGHFLPAAGHGRVLWARLLRWCLRARRDSGVGAAEAGPGAAAVGPRAGPAEVRLSRAGALFRPEAGGRARLRDLPVRSVRGLLSPERRPPHAPDRRRFSGSGHVHRTAVLPLSVSLRRTARLVHAPGPPRSNHHA